MKPRDLVERFEAAITVARGVASALEPLGASDVARTIRRAAAQVERAAELGREVARAAERLPLEREAIAARLRRDADEIERPPGLRATVDGVPTAIEVADDPEWVKETAPRRAPSKKRRRR